MSRQIKKISIPLGAGLWKSMWALFEDNRIIELSLDKDELAKGKNV